MNTFTYNIRYKRASSTADLVLDKIKDLEKLSDEKLKEKSLELKALAQSPKYYEKRKLYMFENLIEAFAIASVASDRVLHLKPYKVQIMAGIAIAEGSIAEQKTGEGKTLTALLPSFLYALLGNGVHVVTVNPYLTERDGTEIGKVHEFLGLSTGIVLPDMKIPEKQKAYNSDVTYVSNSELGFDYLRDLSAGRKENLLIPSLSFAIVDEVDSILLDEAKTPLIISGLNNDKRDFSQLILMVDIAIKKLKKGKESSKFSKVDDFYEEERIEEGDFYVQEKEKRVILTEEGIHHLEKLLNLENYSDEKNKAIQKAVEKSLYANFILLNDKDYVIKNGKIELVDEFTGRILDGRKYSDGLHQAIEAKERVEITSINQTQASITYQNFFRKYKVLSGMTATAFTEKKEFKKTYGLDVIPIDTNKPVVRIDNPDKIFLRRDDKYKAVIEKIEKIRKDNQPILCATASLNESEHLSSLLSKNNIKHSVLNAKQDKHESEIIAKAGIAGNVTVATNMAGRGTDIKLDENARKAGGLFVIGTEKHESKRIDNQLRGRSGRQGDVGESIFYISTEDRLMKYYGGDRFLKWLKDTEVDNGKEITDKNVLNAIELSQKRVGLDNFAQRQNTLFYDEIDNTIKDKIYTKRKDILITDEINDLRDCAIVFIKDFIEKNKNIEDLNNSKNKKLYKFIKDKEDLNIIINNIKENENIDELRDMLLFTIDYNVKDLIAALDFLRDAVSYISLSGRDNKAYYSKEAYKLFDDTRDNIYRDFTVIYFTRKIER